VRHAVGDAAEHEARDRLVAVAADDDLIGLLALGDVDDPLGVPPSPIDPVG